MADLFRKISVIVLIMLFLGVAAVSAAADCGQNRADFVLRVVCRMDGEDPADGSLTFVLWDEQFNILQRVVNLRGNASFAPLGFLEEGRYIYYISQEGGESLTIVYDPAVYQIIVTVEEKDNRLAARVTEVNRVSGDPAGEVRILDCFDAGWIPVFENSTRQISELPPVAEVPETNGRTELWLVTGFISGLALLLVSAGRKST